ncbi:MAG: DUF3014 domain-containing protein [Pseudomonadota bacterium]
MTDSGSSPATRAALIAAAAIALGVGGYLLFAPGPEEPALPETAAPAPAPVPAPEPPPGPGAGHQAAPAAEAEAPAPASQDHIPQAPPEPQLPALEDSDAELRAGLLALLGDSPLARWLEQDHLAQRISAQIARLTRGDFSAEDLSLEPPPGEFQVDRRGGRLYLSPANHGRYDAVVELIEGIDVAAVAEFFHRYRPLFEAAYGELGHPPEQFDTAVLGAIDHLLATPEPAAPTELLAESVAYRFADPALEGLSPARKQLLRMGPDHGRALKARLRALRAALAGGDLSAAD